MSAAGLARVNVTHRKLLRLREAKSLSSVDEDDEGDCPWAVVSCQLAVGSCQWFFMPTDHWPLTTDHWPLDHQHPRQCQPRIRKSFRQRAGRSESRWPVRAHWRTNGGNDDLRADVEPFARIVERVDRRVRVKVQIPPPIDAHQHVPEERRDVVHVERFVVRAVGNPQELGQRKLSLAENRAGLRQQLLRPRIVMKWHVPFTANGEQQRMHARRIDRVDLFDSRQDRGDHVAGELVNELAERGVFLRRPADDRERPHRIAAMMDRRHPQHRKLVRQAVVAQVVAERTFRLFTGRRIDIAADAEVRIGIQGQFAGPVDQGMRWPASAPANVSSLIPSGSGITAASHIAGCPPTKMLTLSGWPACIAAV
jgi:hypothetical protein